jgi:hypothetical protein
MSRRAMQTKAIEKAVQESVENQRTFNIGESDESRRARDMMNSRDFKPLRIFDVPDPVMPAPDRPLFDLFDSRYPDRMFLSTTHFPGAPINSNILKKSQEIDEFNKSKMAGVKGGRKKKSRQKKQHRRHRRRRSTRKHKK